MSDETPYKSDIYDRDALIKEFLTKKSVTDKEEYFFNPTASAAQNDGEGGDTLIGHSKTAEYSDSDKIILSAWQFLCDKCGERVRTCGAPYYLHPLRVAYILRDGDFDTVSITAAILHSVFDLGVEREDIINIFGDEVCSIIEGTQKLGHLDASSNTLYQADAVRKMLFALSKDIRVIFVKIADRLDRIRNIKSMEKSKQRLLATEVIDIWAPLADRLGMQRIKNEFEDLSLKYTNNAAFLQIKSVVSLKKKERQEYLENAVGKIKAETDKLHLKVTITSRAKHFYSIYQKMKKRNKEVGELFDLFALRIICESNADCYTILGIVHGLWSPLEGRFKDYIAMPKANGYQSLHTTVMCDGAPLEVQIRTAEMHDIAEHGVASHTLYKAGTNKDLVTIKDLDILNMAANIVKSSDSDTAFQVYKNELLKDEIFVFTPKGQVKRLPEGSCAIDFAYSIHSSIGEHIIGAKADGKIISISAPLQNTQIVEVLTNPAAHPTQSQLSIVKSAKAHQKIHSWLTFNDPSFSDASAEKLRAQLATPPIKVTPPVVASGNKYAQVGLIARPPCKPPSHKVKVDGTSNVLVTFAKCCCPQYGDLIAGYISQKRGIVIHRASCLTYLRTPNIEKRRVTVEWE